jgi:hypothetical protein
MVNVDRHAVEAQELVPDIVSRNWPEIVPMHTLVIIDAINAHGRRELLVMCDSEQPPWVTSGVLTLVKADVETEWAHHYPYIDEDEETDEDEDEDEDDDDEDYDDD